MELRRAFQFQSQQSIQVSKDQQFFGDLFPNQSNSKIEWYKANVLSVGHHIHHRNIRHRSNNHHRRCWSRNFGH